MAVGNRKGGGGDEIHRIGDRHHRGGVEHNLLGVAAAVAKNRERPLPDPQAIDRNAGLDDLTGGFEPRGEWERRPHLISAADHQAVGEVDAGGVDPDAHLVPLEARALGLFEPKQIGSAPLPATDRLHFLLLAYASRPRRRYRKTIRSGRLTGGRRRPSTAVLGDAAWSPVMEIRLARHGRHVTIVTIDNQPRLNAMTRGMLSELGRLWDELERDGDCRCIILTGAGQRAFTVGADVTGDLSAGPEVARMVNHALLKNDPYSKPIVAAVNGDCVGGGLELMLSTDIRAASPEARFGLTEVNST